MQELLNFLKLIFPPIIGLTAIVKFFLGALEDPHGFANNLIIGAIDNIVAVFPSTPEEYKIFNLLNAIGDSLPIVGKAIVYDIAITIASIAAISLTIKIYKLIPFKAT